MKINRTEKGQALILIAFGIIALLAMTGLAVDASATYSNRQDAQNAADSAALTSALDVVNSKTSSAQTDALNSANTNGFNNDGTSNTVTVGTPGVFVAGCNGQTPSFATNSSQYIQVIIKTTVNTTFGSLVGIKQTHNCVDAIARGQATSQSGGMFSGAGIVALSKTACPAINLTSTTINIQGGGIFDNSSCSTAFNGNWGNNITTNGGCIGVVGGLGSYFTPAGIAQGAENITGPGFCSVLPAQITPDFSMIPAPPTPPTAPTCSGAGASSFNSTTGVLTITQPGTFPSLSFGYAHGQTMPSGVYCITGSGGAFSVTGGATVTAGDVTIVFTNPTGGANIGGGTTMTFNSLAIYVVNGGWSNGGGSLTVNGALQLYASGTSTGQNFYLNGGSTDTFGSVTAILNNGEWYNSGSTTVVSTGPFRFYSTGSTNTTNYYVGGGSTQTFPDGFFYINGGQMNWEGSTILNLHAPTSGPYANIAIFSPLSNTTTMTINGGSTVTVYGTILHPGGEIHLNGSSTVNAWHSQVVGDTITTQGGSSMKISYNAGENILPPSTSATVELIK
jgi:Flp pilus assembly protein TadG